MAGIVAFRLIYYAIPCALAMMVMCKPFKAQSAQGTSLTRISPARFRAAKRAEVGVSRQNDARELAHAETALAVVTTPNTQTALFDPLNGDLADAFPALEKLARRSNRIAFVYKASARHASACRKSGLKALHIADEAVLNPRSFSTDGAPFRQLRRKLRNAAKSGVEVQCAASLPLSQMRAIDAAWQARNGRARGFSMGYFCPSYLGHQRVYLAYINETIVGFASFHVSDAEWCLDLMRSADAAPDGCMHLLIKHAIDDATASDLPRLSLAALPPGPAARGMIPNLIYRRSDPGLARFKTCFAPRREPLYALARGWAGMSLALFDVARAVHQPNTNDAHVSHEDYEFASIIQS